MRDEAEDFLPGMLTCIKLTSPWAQRYAVTTLCRILYTLETGRVASKRAALLWARDNLDTKSKNLITETLEGRSLGWNHSDPLKPGVLEATLALNEYVKQRGQKADKGSLLGYFADCAACSVARCGRGCADRRRSADYRFLPTRNQVTISPMPLTWIRPRRWNR